MSICSNCKTPNPGEARFCMSCGRALPQDYVQEPRGGATSSGLGMFGLSLVGSLLLSFVLIYVFKLPMFLLFGFLPLMWFRRKG